MTGDELARLQDLVELPDLPGLEVRRVESLKPDIDMEVGVLHVVSHPTEGRQWLRYSRWLENPVSSDLPPGCINIRANGFHPPIFEGFCSRPDYYRLYMLRVHAFRDKKSLGAHLVDCMRKVEEFLEESAAFLAARVGWCPCGEVRVVPRGQNFPPHKRLGGSVLDCTEGVFELLSEDEELYGRGEVS
jgi:hypothetical protein